jgi:Ner family transcriptional regulator
MPQTIKRNPVDYKVWLWIHHSLKMRGLSWKKLAAKFNYHPNSIKTAKNYAYPAVEKIIAEAVGLKPQDLFPHRYTADGTPIGRNYPRGRKLPERKVHFNGKDPKGDNHETQD